MTASPLAVARILGDGERRRTQAFTHLQSHYLFRDRFGRPGTFGASAPLRAQTATVPGVPQSVVATPGDARVTLTWAAPASAGGSALTHYEVRSKMNPGAYSAWATVADGTDTDTSAANETSVTVRGLMNTYPHSFQLRAVNAIGESAAVTRTATPVRLIVEGERTFASASGATFTPSAEVGLRHDGGDAETGTGIEVGAGMQYTAGPLTIEGRVRTLVAHEAAGYKEWGMSGAIRVSPSASGRGLTLSIAPAWGRTGSATEQLWSARDASALGSEGEFEAAGRLQMDAGYGFGLPGNRGLLTPYAGLTLGDAGNRTVRTGTRWQLSPDTVVSVEATRQASDAGAAANELRLRAALRF